MDLETLSSGSMSSKKKTPLGNVKHSDNEKNISLKSGSGVSVYSDVDSLSGDNEDVSMSGDFDVNTSVNFGSPIDPLDFEIDEKIIKTPVEVLVKKSFALDINLLAVKKKLATSKTQFIRKIFSKINGFGRATTPSKFERIIKSTFTSEKSMKKAILLAGENGININSDLKKQGIHLNWAIVIKKILMNTPKNMIVTAIAEFGKIKSIKIQLIGLWQKAVVEFADSDQAAQAGEKTCIINCLLDTGNRVYCTVVGFESKKDLDTVFHTEPIFGVFLDASSGGSPFGSGVLSSGSPLSLGFSSPQVNGLGKHLAVLEHSLEILSDQVSVILKKLSFVELVLLASLFCASPLAVSVLSALVVDSDMALDSMLALPASPFSSGGGSTNGFSSSGSKVFTSKMGSLESKMSALEALFSSIMVRLDLLCFCSDKFDGVRIFTSGLDIGYLGTGVTVIINNSLAHHVSRVEEVPGHLISIQLLFKSKLSVTILGLYAGASSETRFVQASAVNFFITKAVNSSIFVVLGGNFNENDSGRSTSFKFCLGLGLVNSFARHSLVKMATWSNFKGVEKTIDFILVSGTLSSAVVKHCVNSVSDFFNMDHKSVIVLVGLGGLLNVWLNGLCKQANKDYWKFRIKNVNSAGWSRFKKCSFAKMLEVKGRFFGAAAGLDLDAMWSLLKKVVVNFADEIFSRHWFCDFQCSKDKHSFKFLGLEFLVAKIVKCLTFANTSGFDQFVKKWSALDANKALILENIVCGGQKVEDFLRYRKSKMFKSKLLQETTIKKAIEKHIERFCSDKKSIIRSVLNQLFRKMVLDHLVVDYELILKPEEHVMPMVLLDLWARQYAPLNYVRDDAFSSVMNAISMGELLSVTNGLSDGKATGLSGIPNELWKHGCGKVLECLLVLLNVCLSVDMVPVFWKRAWTARKILFKILFDHISLTCSKFGVLWGDNFSVLRDTSRLSPVFAVGSVVENVLGKNREIWLVLQDMRKCIKMCKRFIRFFENIHEDRVNRVMTDFGLSNGYSRIFYDLLLCKVKKHKHLCRYHVNSKFVAKTSRVESVGGMTSYLAAGAFYALNIASEFFEINDISINNDKTVAISINQGVRVASLSICDQPISIAKKGEAYCYLGIFLSTEGLSKSSVSKAYSDVCFFVNIMLRKAIMDKQFSYLVSAVLQPIVSYRTQFSFVLSGVCCKWDVIVKKSLKSKAGLPHDFPDAILYHPSLYGLKTFEQVQSEEKIAALVSFFNASGVLGHLFDHRFLDLQVLGWAPLDPLQFPVKLRVSPVNNFLAGIAKIFLSNELSLANNLPNVFRSPDQFPLSLILGSSEYFNSVHFLKHFGVAFGDWLLDKRGHVLNWKTFCCWKRLDPWGLVPCWFLVMSKFMLVQDFSASSFAGFVQSVNMNILDSNVFSLVKNGVYTNGSLRNAGSVNAVCSAATYFPVLDKSIGVVVSSLLSSTLAELQAVALALDQAVIDVCLSELSCAMPDFCNWCWLERCHIFNLVKEKDLEVVWVKVKGHFGVSDNAKTDLMAGKAAQSPFSLLAGVHERYLVAENTAIFGNARWAGVGVIPVDLIGCVDWISTVKIWHLDSYMLAGFTGQKTLNLHSYLMKAVHKCLLIAVQKRLYNKSYPGILCLLCGEVEFSDHVFTCSQDVVIHGEVLVETSARWILVAGLCDSLFSAVLWTLSTCFLDVGLYSIVCKGFTRGVFNDKKQAIGEVVNFIRFIADLHHIEKTDLVVEGGVVSGLSCDVSSVLSGEVVRMLGVVELFTVSFGCHLPYCFFSDLGGVVSVIIDV
ncbi:hypothetical protein G9A89_001284 [Geosiphon pyriformis]|nr:hypothetical protein G9A89_001284 [Geosiphon pyriformis]